MASMNFNTSNEPFRKLMGNGISYTVPRFQRDYSWTEDEWDDLWQDILDIYKGEKENAHYMGYLVLQSTDNKNHDIIDGQQRITTLSLLILAVLNSLLELQSKSIDPENNRKREEQLRNTYIGYLDPVTLISKSKLQLNKHNDSFYQNYLVPLQEMPQRGLNFSEKLIKKAFNWFTDKIRQDISDKDGAELAKFTDSVADRLFFTVITVTDELNAFKVFETLNARGVRLSATDLLKNYLFSVISIENPHETEMNKVEEMWEKIVGKLGSESFPDFLRVYWNSRNRLVRKTDLFKTIKTSVKNKKEAFSLIRELDKSADFYAALRNPEDEIWASDQKKYIAELRMFSVRQPYSLLMIAYDRLEKSDFTRLLRAASILSFRYNVICGMHTGDQERTYNQVAFNIGHGKKTAFQEIKQQLSDIYPEDERFKAAFSEKEFSLYSARNKKVVRYILFSLEKHLSGKDFDFESDKYTIEHILPENPGDEWPEFNEHADYGFIQRLGNYTLLSKKPNREIGNKGFDVKKDCFAESEFEITRNVTEEHDTWDAERIASRQRWMAKKAAATWRMD